MKVSIEREGTYSLQRLHCVRQIQLVHSSMKINPKIAQSWPWRQWVLIRLLQVWQDLNWSETACYVIDCIFLIQCKDSGKVARNLFWGNLYRNFTSDELPSRVIGSGGRPVFGDISPAIFHVEVSTHDNTFIVYTAHHHTGFLWDILGHLEEQDRGWFMSTGARNLLASPFRKVEKVTRNNCA